MKNLYLIKFGELTLRKQNLRYYIKVLRSNVKKQLAQIDASVESRDKRMYVHAPADHDRSVCEALDRTFGIAGYAKVISAEKSVDAVAKAAIELTAESLGTSVPAPTSFRITARRSDKSFPLNSFEIGREIGSAVLDCFPHLEVDLENPGFTVNIEIREKAYLYSRVTPGLRGLPVGVSGRGLLLLSGGIDSPVAGYLAAKRGMRLDAVHFHTYPVTSIAAQQKAQALGRLIGKWTGGMRFFNVPILEIQKRIQERARTPEYTLLFRAAMMRIASDIAEERGAIALITGESLGQVASQTAESMRFTETWSNLPVFRPLITWDKEEIMSLAKRLGTYRTAIMPFQDCCALFAPDHPLIHPKQAQMVESFHRLELEELISAAKEKKEVIELEPLLNPRTAAKSHEASSVPHPAG